MITVLDAVADSHTCAAPITQALDQPLRAELRKTAGGAIKDLHFPGVGDVQGEL